MLKSMTGFGRSEQKNGEYTCKVEVRSVNNRFLEANIRIPKYLGQLEFNLRKLLKDTFARGSFDLSVSLERAEGAPLDVEATPNLALAAQYHKALTQVRDALGIRGEIGMDSVLSLRDLIKLEPPKLDSCREEMIVGAVRDALASLAAMRAEEGRNLQTDINRRLDDIKTQVDFIDGRRAGQAAEQFSRLKEKIAALVNGAGIDETRLAQEAAILAERSDISEEITRLTSHLEQFRGILTLEEPLGRKLEFILQEINRETNTIGSKSSDISISQAVIEIKSILEKIREQIQNIE